MPLNKKDLSAIKELMEITFDEKIEQKSLVTKEDISHLPTKDEFFTETSKIYKKLEDIEGEKDIIVNKVSDHEDRITALESPATA